MKRLTMVALGLACAGSLLTAMPALADDVKIADLPPLAQQTVLRETKGGTITEIEKEKDKAGVAVYEVDFKKDGAEWELKVSNSGKVLERKQD